MPRKLFIYVGSVRILIRWKSRFAWQAGSVFFLIIRYVSGRTRMQRLSVVNIDQALSVRKWAFAADVVRFYAVYKEGGVYMDSDIYLRKRFDRFIPETGCATFNERWEEGETDYGIHTAFFIGSKGNDFCKEVFEYYQERDFIRPDGSLDQTVSPYIMRSVAERRDMSARRRNSIWMVYIYILLIGCRQEAASSIVRMLLGNIGCTEAGVTISLAGNWNVRSSISVMR